MAATGLSEVILYGADRFARDYGLGRPKRVDVRTDDKGVHRRRERRGYLTTRNPRLERQAGVSVCL
jgi:hypothetical protein